MDLFSQSKSDLIRFGDDAYDKGNFASAAYFYTKAITISNAGIKEVVFPYDLKHSNRDFDEAKVKKAKQDSTISDSLYTDSLITVAEQEYVFDSAGAHLNLSYREMEFSEILYKLGDSYRMDHNYELAEEWLEKAIAYPTIKYPLAKFWYGDILMNNEKYEDARNIFSEFITETISEELSRYRNIAKTKMRSCTFAIKKSGNAPGIDVWVADSVINKGVSNFGTVYFGSESDIMFTTTNPIGKKEKGTESGLSCDIEIVMGYKEDNPDVEMLPAPVRSPFHEASGAYNNKDNRLYFTHWEDDVCGIYYSNYFQGAWMAPWTMAKINKSGYKTMNPTLSKDRKTLYFSSDMPGGQGGMDIWYCTLDRWGDATEIGRAHV